MTRSKKKHVTNQKILAKERRLKRYRDKAKQYNQNRTLQNNEKILPAVWGKMGEAILTTGCERGKKILEQNMGTERSLQKSWMNKQLGNRVANARRRPSGEHILTGSRQHLQRYQTGKPLAYVAYTYFGLKNSPPYTTDLLRKWINA